MTEAAFKASYSDWKVIKGRKVVQVIFELPIETADQAYQVLGGMPNMASEIWCGIARLSSPAVSQAEKQPGPATPGKPVPVRADKERRKFGEIAPAQQAGIMCNEVSFHKFLQEKFRSEWMRCDDFNDQRRSAIVVREICKVNSRSEITSHNPDWSALVLAYRLWMNHPEYAS